MANYYIPDPQQRCEQVLLSYVSCSLAGANLIAPTTHFFYGMDNEDKDAPAVIIACNDLSETYWSSRVWRANIDISCKEMAYDSNQVATDTGSMMNLGGNIHSLFGDSKVACAAINANTATGSAGAYDFWAIQTQIKNYQSQRIEDAWISNLNIDVICTLQNL